MTEEIFDKLTVNSITVSESADLPVSATGPTIIESNGSPMTQRSKLNIQSGYGVTVTDLAEFDQTEITIDIMPTPLTANLFLVSRGDPLAWGAITLDELKNLLSDHVQQVDTVTISGTSGTAQISGAGGLTKTISFDNSLAQSVTDFVASFNEDYNTQGISLDNDGADLIFIAIVAGTPFTHPTITNLTGDLDGTVTNTVPNS